MTAEEGVRGKDITLLKSMRPLTGFVRHACAYSRRALLTLLGRQHAAASPKELLLHLTAHFLSALCVTFAASVLDALLWTLFAGTFQF